MNAGRVSALIVVGLVLLAAVDFWQRIYVPSDVAVRSADSLQPATVPTPRSAGAVNADLTTWLPSLQPLAVVEDTGAPTDWTLTLLAVFADRADPFGVVRATPAAGGAARVQRAAPGDELFGYRVAGVEQHRLSLEGPQGPVSLEVFRPSARSMRAAAGPGPTATQSAVSPRDSNEIAPAGSMPQAPTANASGTPAARQPPVPEAGAAPGGAGEYAKENVFELPASMRDLPVVEAPVPADLQQSVAPAPAGQPSKKKPQQ